MPASGGDTADGAPVLQVSGLHKSFLGVEVLHGVDLDLRAGEVHALVGENGAGKSTLMKVLAGVHQADAGQVLLDGAPVAFAHPVEAQQAGVTTVFQEFNLLPERTVAENVFLGREPKRRGLVDRARMVADTEALLADLGIDRLPARARVGSLSVAQQQVVEIVKALSFDARVISMDEPTAALAAHEVALLYRLVRQLKDRGVAILYVSHRLQEIFDLADRVTVLKDGALVTTRPTAAFTPETLVQAMVGRALSGFFPPRPDDARPGPERLRVTGGGTTQLDGIDLTVRAGEIVALAGLQGSGRTELAHALFGIDPFTRGEVHVDGAPVRLRSPRTAIRAGIALVTEDRKGEGLALRQPVLANSRLVLDSVWPRGSDRRAARISDLLGSLELSARSLDQEVRYLSGGNQQKVVLAKWLVTDPKVIVMDEPTRGIDVGAKRAVYEVMRELTAQGVAILMVSSELPEVIGMADRIVVLRDGVIAGELPAGSDEETVMGLATGARLAPGSAA